MPTTPPSSTHGHDYLNPGLPVETRVEDLLGRMTLEEKCSQMYVKASKGSAETPRFSLVGFDRISLQPGESRKLNWKLFAEALSSVEADGSSCVRSGTYQVWVGGCSPDARSVELGADAPLSATFGVT